MLDGGQGLHSGYPPTPSLPRSWPGALAAPVFSELVSGICVHQSRLLWPGWGLPRAPRPPNTRPFPSRLLTSIPTPLAAFNPVHGGTAVDPNRTAHEAGVPEENDLIFRLGLGAERPFWGGSLPAGEEIIKAALPGFLRETVALKRRLMRERERQAQSLGTPGSLSLPQGHPLPDGELGEKDLGDAGFSPKRQRSRVPPPGGERKDCSRMFSPTPDFSTVFSARWWLA